MRRRSSSRCRAARTSTRCTRSSWSASPTTARIRRARIGTACSPSRRNDMKKPSFDWQDPLRLDEQLSDDERAVRDAAQQYAQKKLLPRVLKAFRDEHPEPKLIKEFGDQGLLGVSLEGHGCPGGNHVMYGLVAREIERVDSGYRSALSVQSSLVMYPIHAYGSEIGRAHV